MLKKITLDGETKSISDWARSVGLKITTLKGRIKRNNGVLTKELLKPARKRNVFTCIICGKTGYAVPALNKKTCSKKCFSIMQSEFFSKHRDSHTKLYKKWSDMKNRTVGKYKGVARCYRDKKIGLCDLWKDSYLAFKEWALLNGYVDGLQIDRIDVDGPYCPENCRWVTQLQQSYNKYADRKNFSSKYKGVSWHSARKKWIAQIKYEKKHYYLGRYELELDAYKAYLIKAKELFGEYMDINSKKDYNRFIKKSKTE